MSASQPRYDFYQTDTVVNVSVFIKQARQEGLAVEIAERSLRICATSAVTGSEHVLNITPLFSAVDATTSSFKVLSSKIDITLHKAQPGVKWTKLEATGDAVVSAATPSYTSATSTPPAQQMSSRQKSKWDSFNPDADEGEAVKEEADINAFFKRLYADANEDTRRAMLKSYQESGGTSLSTDWSKVGKGKVETVPPSGMEAKNWES